MYLGFIRNFRKVGFFRRANSVDSEIFITRVNFVNLEMFIGRVNSMNYQICKNRVNFENSSSNLFGHLHRKESTGQTFHFPSWIIPVSMIRWFRKLNIINFIIDKTKMIYFSIYIIYLRRVFKMMLTTLSEFWKVYWPIKKR